MATIRPLTSQQWLARLGLIAALAASEVVLAAACGVSAVRLVAIAVAALVFVVAYVLVPSPGKQTYEPNACRPVWALHGAILVAAIATGAFASPVLPLLAVPLAMGWTMYRPRWIDLVLMITAIAVVLAVFTRVPMPPIQGTPFALLAGWSTALATLTVGRRVQQLLEVQQRQARCLARLREGALTDAASRRRGLESMTTKLAHELKNPLAAIKSLVQVEKSRATDERSLRRLDVVLGEVERIGTILREYLDLARPVEEAHVAPVQLDDLMTDVGTLVTGRAEAAGVALDIEGTGGVLHADARLLKEAIVNLVCNGIEATPRGGSVTVRYELAASGATIAIRDSGRGMTTEVAARVGTPFFTTREGGTGLGVVIARSAIAQHGGTLAYASEPGDGTTATIALPAEPGAHRRVSA